MARAITKYELFYWIIIVLQMEKCIIIYSTCIFAWTPIPIPIPNTRYDTDSQQLFIDITLNNQLISPIPISPIPIPNLGDCFIQIQIPNHTESFHIDTDNGYRYRYIGSYLVSVKLYLGHLGSPSRALSLEILLVAHEANMIVEHKTWAWYGTNWWIRIYPSIQGSSKWWQNDQDGPTWI